MSNISRHACQEILEGAMRWSQSAESAGYDSVFRVNSSIGYTTKFLEMYAELVVRECMRVADLQNDGRLPSEAIADYFELK